jgi:aspartate/methionine/tyrosine aminotransferase
MKDIRAGTSGSKYAFT